MTTENFENLIRELRPILYKVAFNFFHNKDEAEDTIQEVLMKLWMKRNDLNEQVRSLAIIATKNLCVSKWRKQKLRASASLNENTCDLQSGESTNAHLMAEEQKQIIEQAISHLPRSERRLMLMRQQGMENEEIVSITGIPIRSIRTMLSSARKKMIQQLKI
ncbi:MULTISPECIES: RNA polymerase sigma factor [Prevotella]|uniref:RNA polymerase sigma factor n=1 Tax=Prevotella herbatica TaxID=2801997 RepID=UPI001A9215F4|nr:MULTISPECIES: sigma-70 family RNA polymerase sigma factor [Prevotella]MDN5553140.1 sigma-70 family RNA polymerase sigma factor [Prevotella sp.]